MTVRRIKIFSERNSGSQWHQRLFRLNIAFPKTGGRREERRQRRRDILGEGQTKRDILRKYKSNPAKLEAVKDKIQAASDTVSLGWKHAALDPNVMKTRPDFEGTGFVLLVKNPYWFVRSMHKRPYNHLVIEQMQLPLDDFAREPWPVLGRDNLAFETLPTLAHLWTEKLRSYRAMMEAFPKQCVLIRYESTVADPESSIAKVCEAFGCKQRPFTPYVSHTKGAENLDPQYYRERYLKENYEDYFSPQTLEKLNEGLNPDWMAELNYTMAKIDEAASR